MPSVDDKKAAEMGSGAGRTPAVVKDQAGVSPAGADQDDELNEAELEQIVGGIGGSNGIARTGSGSVTPPPTFAPPS
jgi:hypothetical protein